MVFKIRCSSETNRESNVWMDEPPVAEEPHFSPSWPLTKPGSDSGSDSGSDRIGSDSGSDRIELVSSVLVLNYYFEKKVF